MRSREAQGEINPARATYKESTVATRRKTPMGMTIRLGRRWPRQKAYTVLDDQLLGTQWRWDASEDGEEELPTRLWSTHRRLSLA